MKLLFLLTTVVFLSVESSSAVEDMPEPPFGDTVGTVFDIIRKDDPSSFVCMRYQGRADRQIWDKRIDGEPFYRTFNFSAYFTDGTEISLLINPEFGSAEKAKAEAQHYTKALGQLPTSLREGIKRFSVHKGDQSSHAGTGQIVIYAETATQRESYLHLEETIFHEAVHASWDVEHSLSKEWIAAQKADGHFLTRYGQRSPDKEDLAETALFAYGVLHYPGRIFPVDTRDILASVPNRIAYIR